MRGLRTVGYRLIAGRDGPSVVRGNTRIPLKDVDPVSSPERLERLFGESFAAYRERRQQTTERPPSRAAKEMVPVREPARQSSAPLDAAVNQIIQRHRASQQREGVFSRLADSLDALFEEHKAFSGGQPLVGKLDIAFALYRMGVIDQTELQKSLEQKSLEIGSGAPRRTAPARPEPEREEEQDRELG